MTTSRCKEKLFGSLGMQGHQMKKDQSMIFETISNVRAAQC